MKIPSIRNLFRALADKINGPSIPLDMIQNADLIEQNFKSYLRHGVQQNGYGLCSDRITSYPRIVLAFGYSPLETDDQSLSYKKKWERRTAGATEALPNCLLVSLNAQAGGIAYKVVGMTDDLGRFTHEVDNVFAVIGITDKFVEEVCPAAWQAEKEILNRLKTKEAKPSAQVIELKPPQN